MAIPGIPQSFYVQQANGQVYLSWAISVGATSYQVQRSTDGVNFSTIASPTSNDYLDTAVSLSTLYYYQIASTNASGTSGYTSSQTIIPAPTGEMSLGQIRLNAQQRADRVNSNFVTLPEWNSYIRQSCFELYDLLITCYEDYFVAPAVQFTTDGSTSQYPLPNGVLYNAAKPFYKLMGVDLAASSANNAWVTVTKFNFIDRNKFVYPNSAGTLYGVFNCQYRLVGNTLDFIPTPSANQIMRIWYIPRLNELLKDTDTTDYSISGWIEYVIIDAAIKALQKEESDVSVLMAQKMAIIKRIEESAMNRDVGQADTISDVRHSGSWGDGRGYGGMSGPF